MHSAGVAASATALARFAGMSEDECKMMKIAGHLHDIGKLKVPRAILEKPEKLTEEEFNIIKEHPYYTRLNTMNVEGFEKISQWAGFHHEKLNGKGYPFHLSAADLDTGARIMAVADIFSAITEVRPYRAGMSKDAAFGVLNENVKSGGIDGELVAFLGEHYEEIDRLREEAARSEGERYYKS
ncbi:MAG: HD domain-containing protein, partial [Clostridia bacterium]|nr:HD domain-containing protein [Clostridia bacterium]